MIYGIGLRVQDLVMKFKGLGFKVQGLGFRVWGSTCRMYGLRFEAQRLGLRLHGLGLMVSCHLHQTFPLRRVHPPMTRYRGRSRA
jgi:hypothetical protein